MIRLGSRFIQWYRNKMIIRSLSESIAAFDGEVHLLGEETDAGPAFGLHFVEVFHASEIGDHVGSSSLSSFFADGVGSSEVIDALDLHGFGASLGSSEAEESQEGDEDSLHCRLIIILHHSYKSI